MPQQIIHFPLVILLPLSTLNQVGCFTFNYSTFPRQVDGDFIKSSNSYIYENAIQVTPDTNGGIQDLVNRSGKILYNQPFTLWNKGRKASFNTTFVLNIKPIANGGGEGLAFVLAKDTDLPTDSKGQWLGIANANTNGSMQTNIVAVEFDTKKNFPEDLDNNHVGLDINSVYSERQVSLSLYNITIASGDDDISCMINYDGITRVMNVSVLGGNLTQFLQIMSVPIDLSEYLPSKVYVGFAASTGTGSELNCVKSWFFSGDDIDRVNRLWVWILTPTIIVILLLCGILAGFLYRREKRKQKPVKGDEEFSMQSFETGLGPKKFKLKELKGATGNFSAKNELGRGGFGIVYKGKTDTKEVAVKRMINTSKGKQSLIAEITTIANLHHKNLVELIGWCYEKNEFLLVYEYMPNGSLDKFISCDDENMILSWDRRHSIICGVAQSLDYLHHECSKKVLHRDIKTSNILLDTEFNARLGDFGLARMFKESEQTHHSSKEIMGTQGYMAPEIFLMGRSTTETDVFAFGVLVLVVASGRMPGNNIVDQVWELYKSKLVLTAIDPKLMGNFDEGQAECMLVLALACCHPNPNMRPSMRNVLQVLMAEALPPIVPFEKPVFMWPATESVASFGFLEGSSRGENMMTCTETSSTLSERELISHTVEYTSYSIT